MSTWRNLLSSAVRAPAAALALAGGLAVCLAGWLAAPGTATASQWCGENGVVRFSFVQGDSLVPVLDAGPARDGMTRVDVYAWLTDVDGAVHDGEALLAIGGFELKLDVRGAEAVILAQEFPAEGLNVGRAPGVCAYGVTRGQGLVGGRVPLVHWQLLFEGRPRNVRIGLDPGELVSCAGIEGCPGSGTQALYIGAASSNQLNMIFGAGYEPAWLNPEGEIDRSLVQGTSRWQDVGVFEPR